MNLKSHLKKKLTDEIELSILRIAELRSDLEALAETKLSNAEYYVSINSNWSSEGEQGVTVHHKGSLAGAINNAEEEFKKTNKRSDIQGTYQVYIDLGKECHTIPEKFWEQYAGQNNV